MNPVLTSLDEFHQVVEKHDAVIVYFSNNVCGACDVLEDKITALLTQDYPEFKMYIANTEFNPEIAGQNRIFASPSLIIFFAGREQARSSRTVGMSQIVAAIDRPYHMIFEG